jgi:membrane-bound lytic murein transglycosylase B
MSLAALLLPVLVSPINGLKENFYQQIPQETQKINQNTSSYYEKYYKKISSLVNYLEEKGFQLENLLQDPRFEIYEGIRNRFKHSAEKKSLTLEEYKEALQYEDKKNRISDFINNNINQLELAEKIYEIPKYINSAIIGIESDFGDNLGSFNPFNAYFSMYANDYKKEFASTQLEELLIFCEKNNIDVFSLKSSYAGAISYAQFLPSSLNKWFIGNDLYDMGNNILSAANYLSHFKEITGSLEKAIFKYNKSKLFVRTILDLAKDAEEILSLNK